MFERNLTLIVLAGIAAGVLVFVSTDGAALWRTTGIILMTVIVLSVLVYGLWAARHVRCPDCGVRCREYSADHARGLEVVCPRCGIVWDLGISYSQDT